MKLKSKLFDVDHMFTLLIQYIESLRYFLLAMGKFDFSRRTLKEKINAAKLQISFTTFN